MPRKKRQRLTRRKKTVASIGYKAGELYWGKKDRSYAKTAKRKTYYIISFFYHYSICAPKKLTGITFLTNIRLTRQQPLALARVLINIASD